MAQPTTYKVQFLGGAEIKANSEYSAADFSSLFPDGNLFILKTKTKTKNPITVAINKTIGFPIEYNEQTAYDGTTDLIYIFSQDCTLAIGKELALT